MVLPRTLYYLLVTATAAVLIVFFLFRNSPPILKNHDFSLNEDSYTAINLSKFNEGAKKFKLHVTKSPKNGIIKGTPPYLVYTPNPNFNGYDEFSYQARLNDLQSNTGIISFQILSINDSPSTLPKIITLKEDHRIQFSLEATDPENDYLEYQVIEYPEHGKIHQNSGIISYLPNKNFFGKDQLKYQVSDQYGGYATDSVLMTISPENDPPEAKYVEQKIRSLGKVKLNFLVNDVDNDNLEIKIVKNKYKGKLIQESGTFLYQGDAKSAPYEEFIQYYATDGVNQSNTSILKIKYSKGFDFIALKKQLAKKYPNAGIAYSDGKSSGFVNGNKLFVPASLTKIATAAAALYYLKGDYHFKTEIFQDNGNQIFMKGYGNPVLMGRDLDGIVAIIKEHTKSDQYYKLILDSTVFNGDLSFADHPKNNRYYNAPASALAVNYNTIYIDVKSNKKITSLYPSTPVTNTVFQKAKWTKGVQFISSARTSKEADRYTGELLVEKLKQSGIRVNKAFNFTAISESARLIDTHHSKKNLKDVIKLMLKTSNNFIANQLLLIIALENDLQDVSISSGSKLVEQFLLDEVGLSRSAFRLVEGSGLSRLNKITPKAMLKLLNYSKNFIDLFPNLKDSKYPSLSKLGINKRIFAKTGTLNGVSNLAGYYFKNKQWFSTIVFSKRDRSSITRHLIKSN